VTIKLIVSGPSRAKLAEVDATGTAPLTVSTDVTAGNCTVEIAADSGGQPFHDVDGTVYLVYPNPNR
jgi:hypothetical protein